MLAHVLYLRPSAPAGADEISSLVTRLTPDLVGVDSYDAGLATFGLENDERRRPEVLGPSRRAAPVAGACVAVSDHVAIGTGTSAKV